MKPEPKAEIVTASKELIDELIGLDTHNRNKKEAHVRYLRGEIRAGRFALTNQGIGVTASGYICDGGHRLKAIAAEGYPPVQFVLVRNLPDIAQSYVDIGARRNMADVLSLFFDASYSCQVVAILRALLKNEKGWGVSRFPPSDLIAVAERYGESVKRVVSVKSSKWIPAAGLAALVMVCDGANDDKVIEFETKVITGVDLHDGDPPYVLRRFFESDRSNMGGSEVQKIRFLKTCSAVNAFLAGRRITRVYASMA